MSRTIVLRAPGRKACGPLSFLPALSGAIPTKKVNSCHPSAPERPCVRASVVELNPVQDGSAGSPNSSSIFFDRVVTVASFTVSVSQGAPFGNVPGSFSVTPDGLEAIFTANPPIAPGQGGIATSTVVIDEGTDCEQTITWTWNINAG